MPGSWLTETAFGRLLRMSILNTVRGWRVARRQQARRAYAESRVFATAEEQEEIKRNRHRLSRLVGTLVSGGMPEGTGISPTGTPMDFTADQKPPRH